MRNKNQLKNYKEKKQLKRKYMSKAIFIVGYAILLLALQQVNIFATDDPLAVINNLSNFIFGLIRAIGMIILGFRYCADWNELKVT